MLSRAEIIGDRGVVQHATGPRSVRTVMPAIRGFEERTCFYITRKYVQRKNQPRPTFQPEEDITSPRFDLADVAPWVIYWTDGHQLLGN